MATMIVVVGCHDCNCEEGGMGWTTVSANRSSLHRILHFASSGINVLHWIALKVGGGEINNLYCKLVQRAAETRNAPKHLHLLQHLHHPHPYLLIIKHFTIILISLASWVIMSSRPPKYQMIGIGPIWDWEDAKYFMQTSHKVTKVENTCEKSYKVTKVENTLCKQSCKLSTRVENTLVLRLTIQPSVHVHTVLFYYLSTSWSKPLLVVKMTFVVVTKLIVIIVIDYKCFVGRKIIRNKSEELSIQH